MWECPDFFHLGDRHALVVSIWHEHKLYYPIYMIGDYTDQRLKIRNEGFVDLGRTFYAPQSMTDEQGRRIMWGWLRESRSIAAQMKAGWSGVLSLPRQLSVLSKGELGMQPAPELQALRRSHRRWCELVCHGDDAIMLDGAAGAAIEIIVEWEPGDATEVGLKVRAAPDGTEETLILFDRAAQRLRIDRTRSSLAEDTSSADVGGPFRLDADESLRLHVFLDASVIEVFANGRACLSTRIYPTRPESIALGVFARGGRATLRSLDTWRMASIWPEGERCRIPDA
jgi:beta-fructofuranosidase